eukprot:1302428-Prymnesium_polylepis.1
MFFPTNTNESRHHPSDKRPRDDPGVPRPRGVRAGGRKTALPLYPRPPRGLHSPCVLSPDP